MRRTTVQSIVWAGLVSLFCGLAKAEDKAAAPPVVAYFHFVGAEQLGKDANLDTLKSVWDLPESKDLRGRAALHLAQSWAQQTGKADAQKTTALIQPLLEDLVKAETHLELRGQDKASEWTLALRLNDDRANLWQTNLWQLLASEKTGEPKPYNADGLTGWTTKYPSHPGDIRLLRAGGWTVLAGGSSEIPSTYGVFPMLKSSHRPVAQTKEYFWDGEIDFPKLATLLGKDALTKYPKAHLTMTSKGDRIRSQWSLAFPDELRLALGNWNFPTESMRDPIISFTAIQGIGDHLSHFPIFKQLGADSVPNQLYFWSQSISPFAQYWAMPLKNVTNTLHQFMGKVAPGFNTNLAKANMGDIRPVTNQTAVVWRGLPIVVPFLRAGIEPGMMVGGLFPVNTPSTNPPPPGLIGQVTSRTNLVYYDWEMSGTRIMQLRPLSQLAQILTSRPLTPTDSPGNKWLVALQSKLNNTVTEALLTSPREISVTRNSQLGLSGIELIALAGWLENDSFPGWSTPAPKHAASAPAPAPKPKTGPTVRVPKK